MLREARELAEKLVNMLVPLFRGREQMTDKGLRVALAETIGPEIETFAASAVASMQEELEILRIKLKVAHAALNAEVRGGGAANPRQEPAGAGDGPNLPEQVSAEVARAWEEAAQIAEQCEERMGGYAKGVAAALREAGRKEKSWLNSTK